MESLNFEQPIVEEKKEPRIKETSQSKKASQPANIPEMKPVEEPETPIQEYKTQSAHKYLQQLVKKMAEARGYVAVLETQTADGSGQVDVLLTKEGKTIAVEISVTTDADWEMHNIKKCLDAKYDTVVSLSGDPRQLDKIKKKCLEEIPDFDKKPVQFFTPDALFTYLDSTARDATPQTQLIKGYRVNVSYEEVSKEDMDRKRASVAKVVMDSLRKQRKT